MQNCGQTTRPFYFETPSRIDPSHHTQLAVSDSEDDLLTVLSLSPGSPPQTWQNFGRSFLQPKCSTFARGRGGNTSCYTIWGSESGWKHQHGHPGFVWRTGSPHKSQAVSTAVSACRTTFWISCCLLQFSACHCPVSSCNRPY